MFMVFWGLFNIFVGSYSVFYTPLMLKLLPPDKRGAIRGMGFATGACLGLGAAALIPVILGNVSFPHNYTIIFTLGILFLLTDAFIFFYMRQHEHVTPNHPMNIVQYVREMPSSIRENAPFRAMILTCMFLVVANSLLPYYTLYAIRIFSATESHIAALAALAVFSNAVSHIAVGIIADRWGSKATSIISASLVILAGLLALVINSLSFLFVAWVLANLGSTAYNLTVSLLIGEVSPPAKLPLYVGVQTTISLALSSVVLLLLAPAMESISFALLFATVFACGVLSLSINMLVLRKHLAKSAIKRQ